MEPAKVGSLDTDEIYKEYDTEDEWKEGIEEYMRKIKNGHFEQINKGCTVNLGMVSKIYYGYD